MSPRVWRGHAGIRRLDRLIREAQLRFRLTLREEAAHATKDLQAVRVALVGKPLRPYPRQRRLGL